MVLSTLETPASAACGQCRWLLLDSEQHKTMPFSSSLQSQDNIEEIQHRRLTWHLNRRITVAADRAWKVTIKMNEYNNMLKSSITAQWQDDALGSIIPMLLSDGQLWPNITSIRLQSDFANSGRHLYPLYSRLIVFASVSVCSCGYVCGHDHYVLYLD